MPRVFVMRPFGKKKSSAGKSIDFERIHDKLIQPAIDEVGLLGGTTMEMVDSGQIREDMFQMILAADIAICDLTIHNANAFYELGIRHSLRRGKTVLIKGRPGDPTPFDVAGERYLEYELSQPAKSVARLVTTLRATLASARTTDSPVFTVMPQLPEADATIAFAVPRSFEEEVQRATAHPGWLRLLAEEVQKQTFAANGLRRVARTQQAQKDYDGARKSWEAVRQHAADDVEANFALATVYERLHRATLQRELLTRSDQAIQRVLSAPGLDAHVESEARSLSARNLKTRWRVELDRQPSVEARRKAARPARLRKIFETYRSAFDCDLNSYYPGINALQMGALLQDLAPHEPETAAAIAALEPVVRRATDRAVRRNSSDVWARITQADLAFLTEVSDGEVVRVYEELDGLTGFEASAARGQVELFAALAFRAARAEAVLEALPKDEPKPKAPRQVIMFAGHRIDDPNRKAPRFPADREEDVRQAIRAKLESILEAGHTPLAYASLSAGADILFHEVADSLKIPTIICLPMPTAEYLARFFPGAHGWYGRAVRLCQSRRVLELGDSSSLPSWISSTDTDYWERGNNLVLHVAMAEGAEKTSLLVFWDGLESPAPGGTDHMVRLAKKAGVLLHVVDANAVRGATPSRARTPGPPRAQKGGPRGSTGRKGR